MVVERVTLWKVLSLWETSGLVVKEYAKLGYMRDTFISQLKIIFQYLHRRQVIFVSKVGGTILSTISLIPDTGVLPSEQVFPEVGDLRSKGKILEIGNLARNPQFDYGRMSFEPIMATAILWAQEAGYKTSFLSAIPSHGAYYLRSGFEHLAQGEARPHPKVNFIKGVGMILNMSQIHRHSYVSRNLVKYAFVKDCMLNRLKSLGPIAIP